MKWSHSIRALCVAVAMLAAFATTSAWGKNIIRIASPYRVTTLDPSRSAAAGNIEAFGQLYANLIRYDADGKLAPELAESWKVSTNGKQVTLKLRDARFSDGTPITAADVVFSLMRVRDSKTSAYPAPVAAIADAVAKDDKTVVLKLKYPFAPIIANLSAFNTGIVSEDAVRGHNDAFASDPVTSGPYRVRKWAPNDRLVLEANPHYWRKGYPKNDGAELIEVPRANTRIDMLATGEVDAVREVPWSRIDNLRQRENVKVPLETSTVIYEVLLNHARPPFNDVRVRRAAALALDRKAITRAVTFGHAEVANTTLPGALRFHYSDFDGLPYDPAKARKLLHDADAVGAQAVIVITPSNKKIAALIQAQWAAVGLKAKIEQVDGGTWWTRIPDGDYDAAPTWFYNETKDPDPAVRWALCGTCGNRSFYTNYDSKKVDKLTERAAAAQDAAEREKLYHEIQAITTRAVSQIPLFYPPFNNAYSTRVKGLKMTPYLQWTLEEARVVPSP